MRIVFDASTLILLAKTGILREITKEVEIVIPDRVKSECLSKEGTDALLISILIKDKRIEIKKVENVDAIKKIQRDFKIGAGEAEALWLARRFDCPLAVDNGPTIKACKVIGQEFTTALHFLMNLVSKNRLDLPMAMAKLEKLSGYGRYSKRIIEDAVRRPKGGN